MAEIDDKTFTQIAENLAALAIQGSATTQILMALMMNLDVSVLVSMRETIQSSADLLPEGNENQAVFAFALQMLDLGINGPHPKLRTIPGGKD